MKRYKYALLTAFALWFMMFSPWTASHLPFWLVMSCSAGILLGFSCWLQPQWWRDIRPTVTDIVLGVFIAASLWGIFWVGDKVSSWIFPNFARTQVDMVYSIRDGYSPVVLSLLLLMLIGPAEEIFWRATVQRAMCIVHKPFWGFVITTAVYTLIHVPSLNFMLIMAALVCGVVWGGLYLIMPNRLPAIVLSHALWDAAVFIWFPI